MNGCFLTKIERFVYFKQARARLKIDVLFDGGHFEIWGKFCDIKENRLYF
jgi:hypothetical protein